MVRGVLLGVLEFVELGLGLHSFLAGENSFWSCGRRRGKCWVTAGGLGEVSCFFKQEAGIWGRFAEYRAGDPMSGAPSSPDNLGVGTLNMDWLCVTN